MEEFQFIFINKVDKKMSAVIELIIWCACLFYLLYDFIHLISATSP